MSDQAFSDAFNLADEPDQKPSTPAAAPASEPALQEAPAQTDSAAAPAPAPAEQPATQPAASVDWEQKFRSLQGIAAQQGVELRSEREKRLEMERKATQVAPPAPPATPDADDEILNQFEQEAPTVSRVLKTALAKQKRDFDNQLKQYQETQQETFTNKIRPLEESRAEVEVANHFDSISRAHPSWETTVTSPEMTAWVQAQPSYTQREFQRISDSGTAAEIIEILSEFKRGKQAPMSQSTTPQQMQQEQRLRAAQAVETRPRPTSTRGAPEKSFDEAFNED